MATLTAVAAGGNWSSASTWSPAQVPTAADDCIIDSSMTGTVTIDGTAGSPNLCRSLDCTGCTGTLDHLGILNIGDGSGGSLTLDGTMSYTIALWPDPYIYFVSTTTGNTITTAGFAMPSLVFGAAGGSWTFQDDVNCYGYLISVTHGTLNDNGKSVTVNDFDSNNTNTRALTISGSWTLGSWDITDSSGMTLTATGSTLTLSIDEALFYGGGLTYDTVVLGTGLTPVITGANTFSNLSYTGGGGLTDSITFSEDQTVTGTLTLNGNSAVNRLFVKSDTKGTARTLTSATNSMSNIDLQDITGAGAGSWDLSAVTGGSGDCGGNSGITFTTPINCYMKTAVSVSWSASNWYTTSGGSTLARVPLPQDTAIFDANSVTAASKTISLDMPRVSAMNWTGISNTPDFQLTVDSSWFGDVTMTTGMNFSPGSTTTTFENRSSISIDMGGVNWPDATVVQNGPGGTVTQTGDFSVSYLTITSGTWNNDSYAATTGLLTIDGGTFSLGTGLLTCTGSGLSACVISSGTLEMNGNDMAIDFNASGGLTMTISGGTLNLSGQIDGSDTTHFYVTGGNINDTGSAGELKGASASFTGGTSVVRKLTLADSFSQSSTSDLTITGSATWGGNWTYSGTSFTFTTDGIPTWSSGSLTIVPAGTGGGSWTFC